jgi:lipopolysaccharide transport system permease protein
MLPLSRVLAALSELAIAFLALFALMAVLRVPPSPHIVVLPFFLLVLMASSFGAGLIFNALPASLRWVVGLNPMAAVVEGFRWAILGVDRPTAAVVATSAGVSLLLMWVGQWYFGRRHETVADYV